MSQNPRKVVGEIVDENSIDGQRNGEKLSDSQRETLKRQLEQLAWLMDESITIPGLNFRIGLDGLIGLIPGIGDLISAGISSYMIRQASACNAPRVVIAQMTLNTLIDLVIGAVPLVGDLFDLSWKANSRNVALLRQHLETPGAAQRKSWWGVTLVSLIVFGLAASVVISIAWVISFIF